MEQPTSLIHLILLFNQTISMGLLTNSLVGFGYQAQVYIDAVQSIDMTAPQVPPSLLPDAVPDDGVYAVGFERTLSNFILRACLKKH
jgi:hypothetical protein